VSGLVSTEAPILTGLIEQGYTVLAVVSHHTESQSRKQRPLEVAAIAEKHGIPVLLPNKPDDIYDQLAAFDADVAVLSAYGRIVSQKVIDLFPLGIVNIHPSLLPKYRGPTPIESAIANGDTEAGVSIMSLEAGMDSGPVYGQTTVALNGTETKFDLYETLSAAGARLFFDLFPSILSEESQAQPQVGEPLYCQLLSKEDAFIDPTALTAQEIEQRIRAYLVFPKTKMTIAGHLVIITAAQVVDSVESILDIVCKDNSVLRLTQLVSPTSGRPISGKDFLNGYAAD